MKIVMRSEPPVHTLNDGCLCFAAFSVARIVARMFFVCLFVRLVAQVVGTHDASNPVKEGLGTPLITCDVSERQLQAMKSCFIDNEMVAKTYISGNAALFILLLL